MKTINVKDCWDKNKTLTENEFCDIWVAELDELKRLTWSVKWQERVAAMKAEVRNQARREFQAVWKTQNP